MTRNVGSVDRIVRIVAGIAIITAGVVYRSWWGIVGLLPLITGILGFCGVYAVLGLGTKRLER